MYTARIVPDDASFRRVSLALEVEAQGNQFEEDLGHAWEGVLRTALEDVRGALLSMGSGGLSHGGEPLRQAIAAHLVVDLRVRRTSVSARIRALKDGMPRGFWNAPKRMNQRAFRHPVFGTRVWVQQIGAPGWFDDTLERNRARYRVAAARALDKMADRIGRKG